MKSKKKMETAVIHAGQTPDRSSGAVIPPIVTSSTFVQSSPGVLQGYEYSRAQNPTRQAYEDCMASLENATHAFAFASGMAAIDTITQLLKPGDHVIASLELYGGTHRLFNQIKQHNQNVDFSFIDCKNVSAISKAITDQTKMIWIETPSNPLLSIIDLDQIAALSKQHNLIAVCDNTFASPILQRPLDHNFDLVMHSATKYLNGHSDCISGVVATNSSDLAEKLAFLQCSIGAVASPFDSYLVLRGLKTLAIRMERHCDNALALAQWLETHPKVARVFYPGLTSHPQHEMAKKQMSAFGGMISIELAADLQQTKAVLEHTSIFTLAESLGGVESLIEHPAIMTHASIPAEQRTLMGITDSLIRLSVGIEHIDDLKADLDAALKHCK